MSDCSTHSFEYPGMSRLIIRWTDQHERPHDWPFVTLGREVASVEVDGVEYVNAEKLKATNGELCAEVNELERLIANRDESIHNIVALLDKRQARIAELEAGRACKIVEYDEAPYPVCSECGAIQPDDFTVHYCWCCGAKVVDA